MNVSCIHNPWKDRKMMRINWAMMVAVAFLLLAGSAMADEIMPSFSTVPSGWVTDRYQPQVFTTIQTYQERSDVLEIGISSADGYYNRPAGYQSTFYNTQGMQYVLPTPQGPGSTLSADLYIEDSWLDSNNGSIRTDMWGVTTGLDSLGYPIIGFTNYDGSARYRAWDDLNGVWIDLGLATAGWVSFSIKMTDTSYEYYINDILVKTLANSGNTEFQALIMQAYNFYGDPGITNAKPVDYKAHWANSAVPEPALALLIALGIGSVALCSPRFRK
jgi:hypothetical protein